MELTKAQLDQALSQQTAQLATRFNGIDSKFEGIDSKIDRLDAKIDRVEASLEGKIAGLDAKIGQVEEGLGQMIAAGFKEVHEKLDGLTMRVDTHERKLKKVERAIDVTL